MAANNKRTPIKKVFLPYKYCMMLAKRPTLSILCRLKPDEEEEEQQHWRLGEVFQLLEVKDKDPKHLGLGEVIGIKRCTIDGLTESDLIDMLIKPATKEAVVASLQGFYPEDTIDLGTPVEVCTLKRFSYDLSELKALVKK